MDTVKVTHYPTKFDGNMHFRIGYIIFAICHMFLQDYMIKILNDFIVRRFSRYVAFLLNSVTIHIVAVDI